MRGKYIREMHPNVRPDRLVILLSSIASKIYSESEFIQNPKDIFMLVKNNTQCSKNALSYEVQNSSSFKLLSWSEQVSSQDEEQMEQWSTLFLSLPKWQNSQVTSADGQHSGLDVASFIHLFLNKSPTLCCDRRSLLLLPNSIFLVDRGLLQNWEHNILDALKSCHKTVFSHYRMYSLNSQRPLDVSGRDAKEQYILNC